jgi:hypothetical protein
MKLTALTLVAMEYDAQLAFFCGGLGFDFINNVDQGSKRGSRSGPRRRVENDTQHTAIGHQAGGRVWLCLETDDFHGMQAGLSWQRGCSKNSPAKSLTARLPSGVTRSATAGT